MSYFRHQLTNNKADKDVSKTPPMKKQFLLFAIGFLILSCSKDSETPIEPQDTIVGNWQFSGSKYYSVEGEISEKEANSCVAQSMITFRPNGTLSSMTYMMGGMQECLINETADENSENISWENISEGKYKIGSRVRDSIFFPDPQTMEMMSYQNFYDNINEVEIDKKSDVYTRID